MRDDDTIHCSTLLLNPWPERQGWPIPEDIQNDTLQEIASQVIRYAEAALQQKDMKRAISVMVNGECLLAGYTAKRFYSLEPFQAHIHDTLNTIWRMARRQFIKRALLSPPHEFQLYLDDMRDPKLGLDGADAIADFEAVCRSLDSGEPLNADLRKRTARN
jgi:hypothetical protein